jgi:hypothetical protein
MDYCDGVLPKRRLRRIKVHLSLCPDCHEKLEHLRAIMQSVRAMKDFDVPIPDSADHAVRREIACLATATCARHQTKAVRVRRLQRFLAFASAAAILVAGIWVSYNLMEYQVAIETASLSSAIRTTPPGTQQAQKPAPKVQRTEPTPPTEPGTPPASRPSILPPLPLEKRVAAPTFDFPEPIVAEAFRPQPFALQDRKPTPPPVTETAKGDVNLDGRVDIVDSMLIAKALVRGDVSRLGLGADVNSDGRVDVTDSLFLTRTVLRGQ